MKSWPATLVSALVFAPALAGCGAPSGGTAAGTRVAAAFYPLEYVADRVAGGYAEVDNLTSPGVEPHDLTLSIRETALVNEADLVLYQSGFQPSVDGAVEQNAEGAVLDVVDVVDLEDAGDEPDPHFWLDPMRMADLADAVANELSSVDPDHARDFAANAGDLRSDLERLDQEYVDGLASCEVDTVVISHDAFGYLATYGLQLEPIVGLSPGAEPTPAHIAELQDLINDEGVTTVFSETLSSDKMSATLASDLGIETAVLDPLEGLTESADSTGAEDYLSTMRANLDALVKANRC